MAKDLSPEAQAALDAARYRTAVDQVNRATDQEIDGAAQQAKSDTRTCTCYPGEGPVPCPRKFALRDCWRAAVLDETQQHIVRLKNRDRHSDEQALLDYLMRVRNCLEL